jgi:hypothetical protein
MNFGQHAGAGQGRTRGAAGCAEIHFGMGWGRTWGERKGAPKFISAWVGGGQGATEINFGQHAGAGRGRTRGERKGAPKFISAWVGGGQGATEINFGQHAGAGQGRTRGERKGAPKFISAWVGGGQGATEINFGQRAGAGQGRTRGAAGCAEIHFGMGWGRTRGDREGAPKFISAWVVSRSGVTEINFGHRAGAGRGRTRGAAGFAEIHFGMGWGRTWGERKGAPKFIMGWGRTWGDREGAPKFISAWVVGRSGVTEMNFGQRAGAGCGRKWGAAGCAEIHFGMGWGRTWGERKGAPKFISAWVVSRSGVTEINFGQRAGAGRVRTRGAAGCAEIHFGMGCEQKRGDRNKFRSTGRRGAGADAGCGRVRRNSFRHGL